MSDSITIVAACSSPPFNAATKNIQQASARLTWNAAQGAINYQVQYKVAGAATFTTVATKNTAIIISGLLPNTKYVWRVRSKCSLQFSVFTALNNFQTLPGFVTSSMETNKLVTQNNFIVYPNPASSNVNIVFNAAKQSSYAITICDLQGKALLNKTVTANSATIILHSTYIHSLPELIL